MKTQEQERELQIYNGVLDAVWELINTRNWINPLEDRNMYIRRKLQRIEVYLAKQLRELRDEL